jgi:hypothetical protein
VGFELTTLVVIDTSVTGEDWDAPRISHTCGNSLKNSPKKKGGRV